MTDPNSAQESLKVVRKFPEGDGDVWATTWADDDCLYTVADDTNGFEDVCSSNLAISKLAGGSLMELRGLTVNPMTEFGARGERESDNATWKGTGLASIDGILYLGLSRHRYGTAPYQIQQTWDGLVLASEDHGQSWQFPDLRPTFPGRTFSNPNFVQYGKDGTVPAGRDDGYVYAVSSDGSWNNGNAMALARTGRGRASLQSPSAWEFWAGTNPIGDQIWSNAVCEADFILRSPGKVSMTGVAYIEELDRYCMPQWHYLFDGREATLEWEPSLFRTPTRLEFYTAAELWGPWVLSYAFTSEVEGWYNPSIVTKPMSGIRSDAVPVFVAGLGEGTFEHYKLTVLELPLDLLAL